MADSDLMDDGDDMQDSSAVSAPVKKGGSGLISTLIKWVVIVLANLIIIVTVVVITMNIRDKKGKTYSDYPVSEEYRDTRDVLQWYQAIGSIKVQSKDRIPATVITEIALGYTNNDKATPQELSARKVEIIDFLRTYFKNKTVAELKQEEKIKIEIRNEINDNILTKNKIKDVRFTQYDIIEQ
ncbi:flagellar basal body-associated FliL family protein [Treponema pedis]|uniref:flagellar basal body-associated FliL family protein n=1 Tax=Treponema pedis TaxID=409322 RepID=UPI00197DB9D0|nr:flagellar basal body-associated FliL family protein [Treponema pedis]QSI03945.1 flagellar basal body protein FliL [Treponema pedis]